MRRGSEAMEFALTLPVLLILLSGMIDFGWFWWQQAALVEAVASGVRSGVTTPQAEDPIGRAKAVTLGSLADDTVPFTPTVEATFVTDATGEQAMRVVAYGDYVGLWGLLGTPYELHANATMRMEEQPSP